MQSLIVILLILLINMKIVNIDININENNIENIGNLSINKILTKYVLLRLFVLIILIIKKPRII